MSDRPTALSLFAGIGGFDLALERAGFTVAGQVEIDPFCQRVLAARWPGVERVDNVCQVRADGGERNRDLRGLPDAGNVGHCDLLVGGFPCQDLSVAGKRAGLGGERSGLFWEIVRIAKATRPTWGLFENVPGLLSSHHGRDMWTVLKGLRECWPAVGYRILDSRYFGVAQRRRRVFFVCGPTEAGVAQVLALTEGGDGDPAAGVQAGKSPSGTVIAGTLNSGGNNGGFRTEPGEHLVAFGGNDTRGPIEVATARNAARSTGRLDFESETFLVADPLTAGSNPNSHIAGRRREDDVNLVVSDPISASEGRTYTHEGKGNLRLHNVVGTPDSLETFKPLAFTERTRKDGRAVEAQEDLAYSLNNPGQGGRTQENRVMIPETTHALTSESGQTGKGDSAPLVFRKAQKAHDPEDCERWEQDEKVDTLASHGTATGAAVVSPTIGADIGRQAGGHPGTEEYTDAVQRAGGSVRRLTPVECERLQGFPDGFTCLCQPLEAYAADPDEAALRCNCPDSPRYRALGNAVTVNVVSWLAQRLRKVMT